MILDSLLIFSDAQAITATAASTNIIAKNSLAAETIPPGWTQAIVHNPAPGEPIPIVVRVTEDFNTLTSLTVTVETDTAAAFSSATQVASSGSIALASLVAGFRIPLTFMPNLTEAFIRLKYTVTGTDPTTGILDAYIPASNQDNLT